MLIAMNSTIIKKIKVLSDIESLKLLGGLVDAWEFEFDKKELDLKAKYLQVKQTNQSLIILKK